jgi:GTP-binding protein
MTIQEVSFIASYPNVNSCPKSDLPEFAFIGRSNVGKSSLINMLTNKKSLAKVSGTPGKTQLINIFDVDHNWLLTDLPGYGYAKLSKEKKQAFDKMISGYLIKRDNLISAFVLIDIRHELQKADATFIDWLGSNQIPFAIIFTKADKVPKTRRIQHVNAIKKQLLQSWDMLPATFISSAETREGRDEILHYIETCINKKES